MHGVTPEQIPAPSGFIFNSTAFAEAGGARGAVLVLVGMGETTLLQTQILSYRVQPGTRALSWHTRAHRAWHLCQVAEKHVEKVLAERGTGTGLYGDRN